MNHQSSTPSPHAYHHHPAPLARRLVTLALSVGVGLAVTGLSIPTPAWAADELRAVTGFQAVALEGAVTVKVSLAAQERVQVSASGKGHEAVETVVESRKGVPTLVIRQTGSWWSRKTDAVVTVQAPQFKALGVAGSGLMEAQLSNQPSLLLLMAGSGDLNVKGLTAHQVEVNVAGSGDVRVHGAAQSLSVSVAGSGDAWLKDLEAEDVKVNVAGSGDARVNARQRLRVSVAGSGDVRYSGEAKDIASTVFGSGTVKRE